MPLSTEAEMKKQALVRAFGEIEIRSTEDGVRGGIQKLLMAHHTDPMTCRYGLAPVAAKTEDQFYCKLFNAVSGIIAGNKMIVYKKERPGFRKMTGVKTGDDSCAFEYESIENTAPPYIACASRHDIFFETCSFPTITDPNFPYETAEHGNDKRLITAEALVGSDLG